MKRSLLLLASALCFAGVAAAEDAPLLPDDVTILCKTQQQVGFNWRGGNWVQTTFKEKDIIVRKSPENKCLGAPGDTMDLGTAHFRSVCLNVRDFGAQYRPLLSDYCTEAYSKHGDKWDTTIFCNKPALNLNPEGWFHYAYVHSDMSEAPKDDYKDSQYVAVGKCTRM